MKESLGGDGLREAEQRCGFFFTNEMPAVDEWHFSQETAANIKQPAMLAKGNDSGPALDMLVSWLA